MGNSGQANEHIKRAMEYLKAVARMEKEFQARSFYRRRLQAMAEGEMPSPLRRVSGRQRDGSASPFLPQKGDTEPSPVSSVQASLAEMDRELAKEMVQLQAARERIWELFSRLSHPKAGEMLEEFYLNGTSIRVIAARTAYNERHVYRIKNQALQELGKMLRDNRIEGSQYTSN